jgi:hypothetical protein
MDAKLTYVVIHPDECIGAPLHVIGLDERLM